MNVNLNKAKKAKYDEFYTTTKMVETELQHYWDVLENKTVYCPCDDENSAFTKYFIQNFEKIGLKKLIATSINNKYVIVRDSWGLTYLDFEGNGCFENEFFKQFWKECDIIITNPPFSKMREFYNTIKKYNKDFLLIGNELAFTYKDLWNDFIYYRLYFGKTSRDDFKGEDKLFDGPSGKQKSVNWVWYQNLKYWQTGYSIDDRLNEKGNILYIQLGNQTKPMVNKLKDIPINFKEWLLCPPTIFRKIDYKNDWYFMYHRYDNIYVDGKRKWYRVMLRRKDNYYENKETN